MNPTIISEKMSFGITGEREEIRDIIIHLKRIERIPLCFALCKITDYKFTIGIVSGYSAGAVVYRSNQGNGKPYYLDESRICELF